LEGLRKAKADTATGSPEEAAIATKIKALNDVKKEVKEGRSGAYTIDGITKTISPVNVVGGPNAGKTMKQMSSEIIPEQKEAIETENRARKVAYAERLQNRHGNVVAMSKAAARFATGSYLGVGATLGLGAIGHPIIGGVAAAGILAAPFTKEDKRANREAAHKIIMEVKLDSGEKH
jgi:hypothetical protein